MEFSQSRVLTALTSKPADIGNAVLVPVFSCSLIILALIEGYLDSLDPLRQGVGGSFEV